MLLPKRQQKHVKQARLPEQQVSTSPNAPGLYRRVMKQAYVRSNCIPSNSRGIPSFFATISRSSVQAHKAFSATTQNHSSSSDGIPPFLGLLCTIPLPLYPSDDIPVMGSVFWFYRSKIESAIPSIHIPQSSIDTCSRKKERCLRHPKGGGKARWAKRKNDAP